MRFTKSVEVTKLHCLRHRQVDFCVVNSAVFEYLDNSSEFKSIAPTVQVPGADASGGSTVALNQFGTVCISSYM